MSEHALNREQFGQYLPGRNVHPHQLALPGMEHMAHPWAEHLARGYLLQYGRSATQHHLKAWDTARGPVEQQREDDEAASLDWQDERKTSPTGEAKTPGEVSMVYNWQEGTPRGRGLAGALFHSAHYFNFGQSTVPVHSPVRSPQGERFSQKVRPDLRPDVWRDYTRDVPEERPPDKPRGEGPKWPGITKPIHPFEKLEQG